MDVANILVSRPASEKSIIQMKRLLSATFLLFIFFVTINNVRSQVVEENVAEKVAISFLESGSTGFEIEGRETIENNETILAFVFTLMPRGFVIVSADRSLRPVYAYSFSGKYDADDKAWKRILPLLMYDISQRKRIDQPSKDKNNIEWQDLLSGIGLESTREQWPPAGTTPTGGWLLTNWSQGSPYKDMCPVDLNTGTHSVAGCPAVAMAQILNYHKRINNTRFDDSDDYYHSYGSNNKYWIDDDFAAHDFPPFPMLNEYLDSLEANYTGNKPINNDQKAALNFACGIAARQVYSASLSGTYGIEQAYDAYMRFSFDSARLVYPSDSTLNRQLADNIKKAIPAHLGLLSEQSGGHNLVVDGYNTDEYFHFNFGWGGSNNGWYTMPPANIAYNLTIIEGVILDINIANPPVAVEEIKSEQDDLFTVYPNPAREKITISCHQTGNIHSVYLFDMAGKMLKMQDAGSMKGGGFDMDVSMFEPGLYLVGIEKIDETRQYNKLIIQ